MLALAENTQNAVVGTALVVAAMLTMATAMRWVSKRWPNQMTPTIEQYGLQSTLLLVLAGVSLVVGVVAIVVQAFGELLRSMTE